MEEQKRPAWYENKIKRNAEYNKKNLFRVEIKLNKNTDIEIIEHLAQFTSKTAYIKALIIEDMQKKK